MEELARYAQCSEESIRRAVRGLEKAELIKVERTKRNFGKLYKNRYYLISPSHKNVDENSAIHKNEDEVIHKNVGSTHDYSDSNYIEDNKEIKTTSLFMFEPEHTKKVKEIILKGWQDDDAELSGFGLFDDEVPAAQKQKPVSKRSGKTRNLRPQEDWTPLDVASEFASRVYAKLPGAVNVVNTVQLQKILGKNRKQFDLSPIIELEVMRLFLEDNWFKTAARSYPQYVQGRFLKFFTSHLHIALKNLGLHSDLTMSEEQAMSSREDEFVYASDGTRFDNSMPGRRNLDRYEAKLRRGIDTTSV